MRLSPTSLLTLFALGALCGLIGDHAAVASHATRYLDTGGVSHVWSVPLFFPPMVGIATAALAELRLHLAPARPGWDAREALAGVAGVLVLYLLTSILADESTSSATALIAALAALVLARFGGGWAAIVCGVAAAVVGPAIEILMSEAGIFEYTSNVDGLLGVGPWLVPLYFAFGVVAARLGELLAARDVRGRAKDGVT
jgi:hypothetical protein